jgi:ATP-dependent DNA helicase RecG
VAAADGAVAQYPATKGITSTQILAMVQLHRAAVGDPVELLPARLRVAERLPDVVAAFTAAHFGAHEDGRRRLAFDELLLDQLVQERLRAARRGALAARALTDPPSLSARWRAESLPFAPTGDQDRAMAEVDRDLAAPRPMQRLLMGEVGSGKTVVALHAMLRAVEHGAQAALMAPTETLAEQHFATLQALMPGGLVPAALLTGSTPAAGAATSWPSSARGSSPSSWAPTRSSRRPWPSATWPSRWWTSSTASACASARRWIARRPERSSRTCCT